MGGGWPRTSGPGVYAPDCAFGLFSLDLDDPCHSRKRLHIMHILHFWLADPRSR